MYNSFGAVMLGDSEKKLNNHPINTVCFSI